MELRGIGYLGLHVTDTGEWTRFASDVIGLMPTASIRAADGRASPFWLSRDFTLPGGLRTIAGAERADLARRL